MNNQEYVRMSIDLHLFFDRIMKEHGLFLETSFMEKDKNLKVIARNFQTAFSNILEQVVNLANGRVSNEVLKSGEIVTPNTKKAEIKTSMLSGVPINTSITIKEENLRSGNLGITDELTNGIRNINRETLTQLENLTRFKNDILNQVLSCNLYTTNYPSFTNHVIEEAQMYYSLLMKLENNQISTQYQMYEEELFWNEIMKEHAEFIRGLLDPSEKELILTANKFANNYEQLLNNYANNPVRLTEESLRETINLRNFKVTGEEGILNCKIKSIITPLLADHVVREANHFIRILRSTNGIY